MYTVVWLEWKKPARILSAFLSCQEYSSYRTDFLLDDFSKTINKNNGINNNFKRLCLIVRVNVVLNRTVVVDSD